MYNFVLWSTYFYNPTQSTELTRVYFPRYFRAFYLLAFARDTVVAEIPKENQRRFSSEERRDADANSMRTGRVSLSSRSKFINSSVPVAKRSSL